jgi:hypothetical protein
MSTHLTHRILNSHFAGWNKTKDQFSFILNNNIFKHEQLWESFIKCVSEIKPQWSSTKWKWNSSCASIPPNVSEIEVTWKIVLYNRVLYFASHFDSIKKKKKIFSIETLKLVVCALSTLISQKNKQVPSWSIMWDKFIKLVVLWAQLRAAFKMLIE